MMDGKHTGSMSSNVGMRYPNLSSIMEISDKLMFKIFDPEIEKSEC